ncbi:MAG: hypothetical protein OXM61_19520 [Candidatus Poribacteria bacterium]|nr:hypothetical protein [Candidatus Poribacteria bacterium]
MEIESPTTIENTSPIPRSMGFGELLDATFSFYRTHFLRFLGITSIYLLAMLIGFSICLLDDSVGRNERIAIWITMTGVLFGVSIFVASSLMFATSQAYLDGVIRIGAVLKLGIRQFITCFVGAFLFGLIAIITTTLVGLFFSGPLSFLMQIPFNFFLTFVLSLLSSVIVIFVAVYFISHWCFFAAAVLVEGKSIWDGIRRRGELIRRRSLQIASIMTAIFLLYLAVNFIFRFGFGFLFILTEHTNFEELRNVLQPVWLMQLPVFQNELRLSHQLMHLIYLGIDTITMPIWVIGATLLYFDQRIRREGFDIEMMAARQGG